MSSDSDGGDDRAASHSDGDGKLEDGLSTRFQALALAATLVITALAVALVAVCLTWSPPRSGDPVRFESKAPDAPSKSLPSGVSIERAALADAIFLGRRGPTADSLGSALGAAEYFGGQAACSVQRGACPDRESAFLMQLFDLSTDALPLVDEVPNLATRSFVLVGFSGEEGLPPRDTFPTLPELSTAGTWRRPVVGIIDYNTPKHLSSERALYVEILPWGSASTIVAMKFLDNKRKPSRATAGMLLGGILCATAGLRSPGATDADRQAVFALSDLDYDGKSLLQSAGLSSYWDLAVKQFEAKSVLDLGNLQAVFAADVETIALPGCKVAISAIKVTSSVYQEILGRDPDEMHAAMTSVKAHARVDFLFVVDVDVLGLNSTLIVESTPERDIAAAAFTGVPCATGAAPPYERKGASGNVVHLIPTGSCISRRSSLQPALLAELEAQEVWCRR
mmetsp:Transcript_54611/g.152405  ORF Transcript_54611/g.152405 Transcript_54611/m.152405 type:complete len:452 (+) Transcript_54611:64-1419(+)